MIRINLLATERKAEKKKAPAAPGALQAYVLVGLFGGVAALACVGGYWLKESQLKELDAQIKVAVDRQKALEQIKKQVEEFEARKKLIDEKVNLIDKLKAQQADAVHMLDEISKALPEFVWLTQMDQAGPALKFQGQSNSLAGVAELIANLQRSGWFPKVDLDSSTEANRVVSFQVSATFQNPEVAAKEKELAAKAPPPAPPAKK